MGAPAEKVELFAHFPPKLAPLLDLGHRFRYYVAYGGRGGGKSWSYARALVLLALQEPLRILCAREIQKTIRDSVHQLLCDQIEMLGLQDEFTITEKSITSRVGAVFLFAGLRDQDAHKIKSFEGVDIVWVEEAHVVTRKSWKILIPTIRAENSEIWVTFNPELDTDETFRRFVIDPPEDAYVVEINYYDNDWFPEVLEQERLRDKRSDTEDEYENIWLGRPRTVLPGAIYAREVVDMLKNHRYTNVPYDPTLLVHTVWDLGWNDQTSIIFVQKVVSEVRIIDYEEDSFLRLDEWAKILMQEKDYLYGDHWLPHDGDNQLLAAGGKSTKKILKPLLKKMPKIIKQCASVEDPIRAARQMWPRVYMDKTKCGRLRECLSKFRRAIPKSTEEPGLPVKDEYRHAADAFGGLATVVDKLHNDPSGPKKPRYVPYRQAVRGVM